MKLLTLITIAVLGTTGLRAEPEIKGTPSELAQLLPGVPGLASISAEAELKVPADRAVIRLRVVTENRSLQDAIRANQDLRARITRLLTDRGVAAAQIQTARFTSTPKPGVFTDKAKSYRVEGEMKISTTDEKGFQAVSAAVDGWSEVRYEGAELEHSAKEEWKRKAIEQALDRVAEKKRVYEEKLGVKLTPKGFTEGNIAPVGLPARGRYDSASQRLFAEKSSGVQPSFTGAETAVEELPSSFGELVFIARVTVDYTVQVK